MRFATLDSLYALTWKLLKLREMIRSLVVLSELSLVKMKWDDLHTSEAYSATLNIDAVSRNLIEHKAGEFHDTYQSCFGLRKLLELKAYLVMHA